MDKNSFRKAVSQRIKPNLESSGQPPIIPLFKNEEKILYTKQTKPLSVKTKIWLAIGFVAVVGLMIWLAISVEC